MEEYQRSPESKLRYWQCNKTGHKRSACPRGERCFICSSHGHKRIDCLSKRTATVAEKGKAIADNDNRGRCQLRTGGQLWIGGQRKEIRVLPERRQNASNEHKPVTTDKEWAETRPGRTTELRDHLPMDLKKKVKEGISEEQVRRPRMAPVVFFSKSEEVEALRATGGVLTKANSYPTIRDFINAVKKMCLIYANWNWKPISIAQRVLFQFPSVGEGDWSFLLKEM